LVSRIYYVLKNQRIYELGVTGKWKTTE
jgi:hypothetical protein